MELNPRSLQGLIYSCHSRWNGPFARSVIVARIKEMLSAYKGLNRVINKWQSHDEAILGLNGPQILAEEFFKAKTSLKDYLEAWYLDSKSAFTQQIVISATEESRARLTKSPEVKNTLFKELLPWGGWDIKEFKAQISYLILDRNSNLIWNLLQALILGHKELGHPLLERNRQKWQGVSEAAKKRFLEILSQDDIIFFFDHVLPTDKDRQNRKQFWLQYRSQYTASRPLLGSNDRVRLRPILREYRGSIEYFGELESSDNSAFLLDFGSIIVVEFSKIGACFIYDSRDFNKILPDFWARSWFSEPVSRKVLTLKGSSICIQSTSIGGIGRGRCLLPTASGQGIHYDLEIVRAEPRDICCGGREWRPASMRYG